MAVDIVMPHMGESVAEGTVLGWLKAVGDEVAEDEPLVEIATDKINVEVPAPASGVLTEILTEKGGTVEVGQTIGRIGAKGEKPAAASEKPPSAPKPKAEEKPGPKVEAKETPEPRAGKKPERMPPAPKAGAGGPEGPPPETGAAGRPAVPSPGTGKTHRDFPAAPPGRRREEVVPTMGPVAAGTLGVLATPAVRRFARERLVDLGQVAGTGRLGRITHEDVEAFLESRRKTAPAPEPAPSAKERPAEEPASGGPADKEPRQPRRPDVDEELVPLSKMRRAIAEHLVRSKRTAPHVTTVAEVDMTGVARRRREWKARFEAAGAKLTFTVFICSAVARALKEFPDLNAEWTDDGILLKYRIHLGLAVSVEDGLVVPVIRDADRLDLVALAAAIGAVAEKTRAGKVSPQDVGGGTFTITNPGVFGAVLSTPIIHQPQAAILATGRIADVPAVVDGGIAVRQHMYLSLSYDHRVVDGATAVRFLQRVRQILEDVDFALSEAGA
jgi:2-oxoglutarate dehydrogenase E2 component (dihydrolipoamide succinyltransferase)